MNHHSNSTIDNSLSSRFTLLILLALAFLFGGYMVWCRYFIFTDGVGYALLGKSIATGEGLQVYGARHIFFPPGYPLAIAFFYFLTHNAELAGHLVSLFSYIGTVFAVYYLAYRIRPSRHYQLISAMLVLLHPVLLYSSGQVMSESFFVFILTLSGLCCWLLSEKAEPPALLWASWGFLLGLCYLIRADGILYLPLQALFLAVFSLKKQRRFYAEMGLGLACCAITILPYLVFLHQATGHWQLSGKTSIILDYARIKMIGSSRQIESQYSSQLAQDGVSFTVAQGKDSLLNYILQEPLNAIKRVIHNSIQICIKPDFLIGGILFFTGLILRKRNKEPIITKKSIFILLHFIPLFFFLLLFIEYRFLLAFIPFGALGVAYTLENLLLWCIPHRTILIRSITIAVTAIGLSMIVLTNLPQGAILQKYTNLAIHKLHDIPLEHKQMGEWMKEHLPIEPSTRISHRNPWVSYYAGAVHARTPYINDLGKLCDWAKQTHVKYLIVDDRMTKRYMPVLSFLLDETQPHPGLRLIYRIPNPKIILYEFVIEVN